MVLFMPRPMKRKGSSIPEFRARVPADLRTKAYGHTLHFRFSGERPGDPDVTVSVKVGRDFVKFSLRTRDPATAKARHAAALAVLQTYWQCLRHGPVTLDHEQVTALAGIWYRQWVANLRRMPGSPEVWRVWCKMLERVRTENRLEVEIGPIADEFLSEQGVVVDADTRTRLCMALHQAMMQAGDLLRKFAEGDYRPDPDADRFPQYRAPEVISSGTLPGALDLTAGKPATKPVAKEQGLTFDAIFERWWIETKPAASTVATWRGYIAAFKKFIGHNDPAKVTKADVIRWKDELVAAGRQGIGKGQIAALKAIFNFAVDNELMADNPAANVKVREKTKAGEKRLPYDDDEVARLLALADAEQHPGRRWLPWLTALSGARIGEITQLWGQRVVMIDGLWVMKIAPAEDGGSLKNEGSERTVPIHPAILERGFLDFVRSKGAGPLFYGPQRCSTRPKLKRKGTSRGARSPEAGAMDDVKRHASKGVANHLAAWIRENGFNNPRKAPNHALRHWFKVTCDRITGREKLTDAIQGHAGTSVADSYRHPSIKEMADAIARIPVPQVDGSAADHQGMIRGAPSPLY